MNIPVSLDPTQLQPIQITAAGSTVAGLNATSTTVATVVPGSTLKSVFNSCCSYQLTIATNEVTCSIYASIDGVNYSFITSQNLTVGTHFLGVTAAGYLYYQLYIADYVSGNHGVVTGAGFCI